MIWYSLISLTLLYYIVLWVVLARKEAMEKAAKEVFGPTTGIEDLLRKNNTYENQVYFGPVGNREDLLPNLINTVISTPSTMDQPLPNLRQTKQKKGIPKKQRKLPSREQLFSGTSLDMGGTVEPSSKKANPITIELQKVQKQSLKAELTAIATELQSATEDNKKEKPYKTIFNEYGLSNTMKQLFRKDMQEVAGAYNRKKER